MDEEGGGRKRVRKRVVEEGEKGRESKRVEGRVGEREAKVRGERGSRKEK